MLAHTNLITIAKYVLFITIFSVMSCAVKFTPKTEPVQIPFLKNSANECYYLDEFMPTPDNIVSGRTGSLYLRYYTYQLASYKEWSGDKIVLSFYSKNDHCWSLFEEFLVKT